MTLLFSKKKSTPASLSSKSEQNLQVLNKKTPNTPPRAHSLPKGLLSPKEPSWHELPEGTTLHSTGTLDSCRRAEHPDQRDVTYHVGSRATPDMALNPPPTQWRLHTITLLLPCTLGRQQGEWMLTADILVSTRSKRVRGDNSTQRYDTVLTWHCRQLLFCSQIFFSDGIQTALTGRFGLSATEWELLRPPEEGRRQVF